MALFCYQRDALLLQADTLGFGGGFDFAGLFSSRGSSALDKYESHVVRRLLLVIEAVEERCVTRCMREMN